MTTMVPVHDLTMRKWLNGVGGQYLCQNLREKSMKICCQSNIYEQIFGGSIGFEFENAYKLKVASQRKTLSIFRIEVLSSYACMNCEYFEPLIVSLAFEKFPKEIEELLSSIMSLPAKTAVDEEAMSAE